MVLGIGNVTLDEKPFGKPRMSRRGHPFNKCGSPPTTFIIGPARSADTVHEQHSRLHHTSLIKIALNDQC